MNARARILDADGRLVVEVELCIHLDERAAVGDGEAGLGAGDGRAYPIVRTDLGRDESAAGLGARVGRGLALERGEALGVAGLGGKCESGGGVYSHWSGEDGV